MLECGIQQWQRQALSSDRRFGKVDFDGNRGCPRRLETGEVFTLADFDLPFNPYSEPGQALGNKPRLSDQRHEWRAAAVDNRYLVVVDLDHQVIDAACAQRGHQVLDRAQGDAELVTEHRTHAGIDHVAPVGAD